MTSTRAYLGLKRPPLLRGILLRRYKRFLADVEFSGGERIVAHCPNSGSMKGCCEPGRPVYLSVHDNPKRRLKFTWEMIEMPDSLVGVNTMIPNRVVKDAVERQAIPELSGYTSVRSEVKCGERSRLDLLLEADLKSPCYIEVKNCTLLENCVAAFPDAVTSRGLKHLGELRNLVATGNRAVLFILVHRGDAKAFAPADHIDPAFGRELRSVVAAGVEILCYDTDITIKTIRVRNRLPVLW